MNKLTAEKCCQLLDSLNSNGMSILEGYYCEALEIALPILEQRERSGSEWIQWVGGECPVADHVKVEYQLRAGAKGSEPAKRLEWRHEGKRHDIIAYRIIPEQTTNQNGEQ